LASANFSFKKSPLPKPTVTSTPFSFKPLAKFKTDTCAPPISPFVTMIRIFFAVIDINIPLAIL